jgi:hypothetical protein
MKLPFGHETRRSIAYFYKSAFDLVPNKIYSYRIPVDYSYAILILSHLQSCHLCRINHSNNMTPGVQILFSFTRYFLQSRLISFLLGPHILISTLETPTTFTLTSHEDITFHIDPKQEIKLYF